MQGDDTASNGGAGRTRGEGTPLPDAMVAPAGKPLNDRMNEISAST